MRMWRARGTLPAYEGGISLSLFPINSLTIPLAFSHLKRQPFTLTETEKKVIEQ